jgi:hypothetical protein
MSSFFAMIPDRFTTDLSNRHGITKDKTGGHRRLFALPSPTPLHLPRQESFFIIEKRKNYRAVYENMWPLKAQEIKLRFFRFLR